MKRGIFLIIAIAVAALLLMDVIFESTTYALYGFIGAFFLGMVFMVAWIEINKKRSNKR